METEWKELMGRVICCDKEKALEVFLREVLNSENSFYMKVQNEYKKEKYCQFLQVQMEKVKYVYQSYEYYESEFFLIGDKSFELSAIVTADKVYLQSFYWYNSNDALPDNVVLLSADSLNTYFREVAFPKFYESLPMKDVTDEKTIAYRRETARGNIIHGKKVRDVVPKLNDMYNKNDLAMILCGRMNLEEETARRLKEKEDSWISTKSFLEDVKLLMAEEKLAEEWEIRLADSLEKCDAKTVTVEFELNGNRESGKMSPQSISEKIVYKDYFNKWDFLTGRKGKELLEKLGVNYYNTLTCENIVRITYKKKELYNKANGKMECNKDTNVKQWYLAHYPDDHLAESLDEKITFEDLINILGEHQDIYKALGVSDSVIRERCFEALAEVMKWTYEDVYNLWLCKEN